VNGRVQLLTPTITGVPRTKWCPTCKALTAVAVDVLALFPAGPSRVATVEFCEIHDDPDDPEATRG
jgi:hypothetical protein